MRLPASFPVSYLPRRKHSVVVACLLTLLSRSVAAQADGAHNDDPRWTSVRRVFGQKGEVEDGYFRVNLPRADLHVRIGGNALAPAFEFTSYVGFIPIGGAQVVAVGEVVLRDDEVSAALEEAHRQGVSASALHNHLIGESPRIMYMHVMAEGTAEAVAAKLHAVFAKTATPFAVSADAPATVDWKAVDAILGAHSEAKGMVAEWEFPRFEHLTVHHHAVKSSGVLETGSEVVFQQLGAGRVASTGELFVLPGEVEPVVSELEAHGMRVTAIHTHMIDASPVMYWIHWYTTGDGPTLARGVAGALAHMNGAHKTAPRD